jgi:enamine deaminase RidA (YjgF/YER057c/UK114 family)
VRRSAGNRSGRRPPPGGGRRGQRRLEWIGRWPVDPWTRQARFGYSQAWRVDGARTLVVVAWQGPVSADGELVGAGDFFPGPPPAGTVVGVTGLAVPGMLLEMAAVAAL